jgi:predicted small secreted protein
MRTATLVAVVVTLSGCGTIAGLGEDLGLSGRASTRSAKADKAVAPAMTAPVFAPGQVVTVVKPAVLRDGPSLDGNVIGYGNVGDTYLVFDQRSDWVQIGSDQPIAWVFDTLIRGGPIVESQ